MATDYYAVLGVPKDIDDAGLKKAYRRFAMKYHPDRNPGDKKAEQKFKEVKQAYEILSDPEKRAAYDQFGEAGINAGAAGGFGGARHAGGFGGAHGFSGFGGIDDIFGEIFGGSAFRQGKRGARSAARRGEDFESQIELSLEEAARGLNKKLKFTLPSSCDQCKGSGAKPGSKPSTCSSCHGTGFQSFRQGPFTMQQTCSVCHGEGQAIGDPCHQCNGTGQVSRRKTLEVTVPAGVDTGDRIRLAGEGGAGFKGGPSGDLYLTVRVKPHPFIKRDGANLLLDVPVSFATAALGGQVEVPTLDSRVQLKIPAGTQAGEHLRLRGKGIRTAHHHGIGDMICHIQVETPVNLTDEQKGLLRTFESSLESGKHKHSPRKYGWFTNIKKFFSEMGLL